MVSHSLDVSSSPQWVRSAFSPWSVTFPRRLCQLAVKAPACFECARSPRASRRATLQISGEWSRPSRCWGARESASRRRATRCRRCAWRPARSWRTLGSLCPRQEPRRTASHGSAGERERGRAQRRACAHGGRARPRAAGVGGRGSADDGRHELQCRDRLARTRSAFEGDQDCRGRRPRALARDARRGRPTSVSPPPPTFPPGRPSSP